ncbi:Glycosyl transferase family 2 [Fibrobacter sp. UWT2]|uniref:glycosyltransferase family 2 protein n=1 Tax=Fibrobacter sp. UWT2 TaxID=1896224 RepID=UPI00090FBA1D|nr:glycosyltransferase [Fibrobacter sp. UWT2]SHL56445.1 Glycosyl transferase family 2 [Fibrobacter sp. UWT2]
MLDNPLISIIMPVYNAKRFLESAIESILSQSLENFELILIDDGSFDGSASICDDFAKRDSRIILVHQKNMGTSFARNVGLKMAKGKYVAFCDHDDEFSPEMLKSNYEIAEEYKADVVCCSVKIFYPRDEGTFIHTLSQPTKVYGLNSRSELVIDLKYNNNTLFGYVWNHLYRRDVIENLKFDVRFRHGHEDQVFNLCTINHLKGNFVFNESTFYKHYSRLNSSSKTFDKEINKTIQEDLILFDYEYNFAIKYGNCHQVNGGHVLASHLYALHYRSCFRYQREFKAVRKCDYISKYPLPLTMAEKILLFSFRKVYPLFKVLCGMNWARYIPGKKEMILSSNGSDFWESPLCSFFWNLYASSRGRWLFSICNTIVRIVLIPFNILR